MYATVATSRGMKPDPETHTNRVVLIHLSTSSMSNLVS